jgi:hypothetical protein
VSKGPPGSAEPGLACALGGARDTQGGTEVLAGGPDHLPPVDTPFENHPEGTATVGSLPLSSTLVPTGVSTTCAVLSEWVCVTFDIAASQTANLPTFRK